MSNDVVTVDVDHRIALVTMNRPESRNALNAALRAALGAIMADLAADPAVDVVILTGADPAFCAGLDLKEVGRGDHDLTKTLGANSPVASDRWRGLWRPVNKPLIGAINGAAVTGGLELALQCDFLVASERACFADTHARVGVQPGWGLTVNLPAAVGLRRAREMSVTGNYIDAATALAWGLVNHVVAHGELLVAVRHLAADIVSNDQAGVRRILRTYFDGALCTGADALRLEHEVASAWVAAGGAASGEVERRRRAIIERGREQIEH